MKITFNLRELITYVSTLTACASDKKSRPVLQTINFKYDQDKELVLTATNSAILVHLQPSTYNLENDEGFNKYSINIPAEELLKKLKALLPSSKKADLDVTIKTERDLPNYAYLETPFDLTKIQLYGGDYAVSQNMYEIYHSNNKDGYRIVIGKDMLQWLAKIAASTNRGIVLEMPHSDKVTDNLAMRPIPFTLSGSNQLQGLFCPCRLAED